MQANFQNAAPQAEAVVPRSTAFCRPKVALLLNCNARSVDAACLLRLRSILGPDHVFASHTLEEACAMARHVVQAGYDVVACGGGDGTLAGAINRVRRARQQHNAWRRLAARHGRHVGRRGTHAGAGAAGAGELALQAMPAFAFIPLGTGNALKRVVHSHNLYAHVEALACGQQFATRTLPLIEDAHGETFFFGGMGYDSLLLHDYNQLLQRERPAWMQPWVRSIAGYLTALGGDTLPRVLRGEAPLAMRVVSHQEAHYFDPRSGDTAHTLPAGSVLWDGPAGMLGVGTVPYFGYGMRVFPFADRLQGAMQLRIATLSAPQVLAQLAPIWRGTYRNPHALFDFAVREVSIELAAPFPFERCGDDCGPIEALRLRMAAESVTLLDFARPHACDTRATRRPLPAASASFGPT